MSSVGFLACLMLCYCTTPGDLIGRTKDRHSDIHQKLDLDGLGCLEKPQQPGSSMCLLYSVEQGGRIIAFC